MEIDAGAAFQSVDCAACGFAWTDNYKLIGYWFQPEDEPPHTAPPASFDRKLRGKPKVDALEAPPLADQLTRHLSAEEIEARALDPEEAERRHLTDAGGKA